MTKQIEEMQIPWVPVRFRKRYYSKENINIRCYNNTTKRRIFTAYIILVEFPSIMVNFGPQQ